MRQSIRMIACQLNVQPEFVRQANSNPIHRLLIKCCELICKTLCHDVMLRVVVSQGNVNDLSTDEIRMSRSIKACRKS